MLAIVMSLALLETGAANKPGIRIVYLLFNICFIQV